MKRSFSLLALVALVSGGGYLVWRAGQARIAGLVQALERFRPPANPYHDPIVREYWKYKSRRVAKAHWRKTPIERWEFENETGELVRDAWARRRSGTLPLAIAVATDNGKPANHRIGTMMVLGFSDDVPESRGEIVATLLGLLGEEPGRIAEFAAFSLGCQGRKTPPASSSVGIAAAAVVLDPQATEPARYWALIALRDHRETLGPAALHAPDPCRAIVAALRDPSLRIRALAANEAWRVRGLDVGGTLVHEELFRLLGDPEPAVSNGALESLRFKAGELPRPVMAFAPTCEVAYGSPEAHSRANAIHLLNVLNEEATQVPFSAGTPEPPRLELYFKALAKDGDTVEVRAAIVEGLAHFGDQAFQLEMAHYLIEDGIPDLILAAVVEGLRDLPRLDAISGILVEALQRPSPSARLAAATLCKVHGTKVHVPVLISVMRANTDWATYEAALAAVQAIAGSGTQLRTPDECEAWAKTVE